MGRRLLTSVTPLMTPRVSAVSIAVIFLVVAGAAVAQSTAANPVNVVRSCYDAFNARQIGKAMTYVADNAVYSWPGGLGTHSGKHQVRQFLESLARRGWTVKLSNFRDDGGRVTYTYDIYENAILILSAGDGVTIVKNGKIVFDGTEATAPPR